VSKLRTLDCLDVPGWTGRIGGQSGRHAKVTRSIWYNPVPWVIIAVVVTWVILMARQVPCIPVSVHPYTRLCYSDVPILYWNKSIIWSGGPLYSTNPVDSATELEYPVLIGGFIWLARWLSGLFGAVVSPLATTDDRVSASVTFWAVTALLLFVCFCVLVWAHLQMGRDSATQYSGGTRTRAWDALFIAAAPVVMLAGLINWDMLAVALTSVALLLWARQHPIWAGVVIGLAAAVKFYPLAMIAVFFLLCLRAGCLKKWGVFMAGGVVAWLAVNLPVLLTTPQAWAVFWVYNAQRGADFGSLWFVLTQLGVPLSADVVSIIGALGLAIGGGIIVGLVLSAPRRPRVGQVALLVMVVFLVVNKVYSPQYVLWLLPLVVLARPVMYDLLVFTVAEAMYYFAVWGYLAGALGPVGGPAPMYYLAVLLRIGVQLWLAKRVVDDMMHPWFDPVRGPFIDDPIGGVLNHAPDAAWMLRAPARRAPLEPPEPLDPPAQRAQRAAEEP